MPEVSIPIERFVRETFSERWLVQTIMDNAPRDNEGLQLMLGAMREVDLIPSEPDPIVSKFSVRLEGIMPPPKSKKKKKKKKKTRSKKARKNTDPVPHAEEKTIWERVKIEMHLFFCTRDRRYSDLRRKIGVQANKSQATVIAAICAAIGARYGLLETVVLPWVAICVLSVIRMGTNAYCAGVA
jgi:hypothetical protein